MTNEQMQNERRRAPIAAAIAAFCLIAIFASQALDAGVLADASDEAESLTVREGELGGLMPGAILQALAFGLLAYPIWFLFTAAESRSDQMSRRFKPLILIGALAFAASSLLSVFALDSLATDFVDGSPTTGDEGVDRAEDLLRGSGMLALAGGLAAAGTLGLAFGTGYSALHAMRTGLFTRFWGTLGMSFAAVLVLGSIIPAFSALGLLGVIFVLFHAGMTAWGRWPADQPPAWAAGTAVPWPVPGQQPEAQPEELARPEDFEDVEGDASEVSPDRPGRRDNKRKRKRKARG